MPKPKARKDEFLNKGAVEQESPKQEGNTNFRGQLGHRNEDPLIKSHDTDFPEPGENPEHTGEPLNAKGNLKEKDEPGERSENPEGAEQNQDPRHRQKKNQADKKDDPLAA